MNLKLHDEWQWIVTHAWSFRFLAAAFVLSALEVLLPLVTKHNTTPLFAVTMGLLTGAAFVARLVAQKKEIPK